MNIERSQVERSRDFLIGYRRADPRRLQFEQRNLYDLPSETRAFDEIICFEVLEHVKRDREVVEQFYRILRPGGSLHLCCPFRLHPRHQVEVLDTEEAGGHVRQGYTEAEYRTLLESVGFRIDRVIGLGSPSVFHADRVLRGIRSRVGDVFALPFVPFVLPAVWLAKMNPPVPFSIYATASKPQLLSTSDKH